jgi:mannitol operon repressor
MNDLEKITHPAPFDVTHPHLKDFFAFLPELNKESDRGMALIATSFIDELLRRTIAAFLLEGTSTSSLLDGFNAPLGSFSTRIAAAAAMGLISEREAKEADRLRKIRNVFAHHVHVSFEDQSINDICQNLDLAAKDYGDVVVDTRGRFSTSAVALIMNLTNRPHYVAKRRLGRVDWKI